MEETKLPALKKFKHTLDSDEEDDDVIKEQSNILDLDEEEGFEKSSVEFDGNTKITPFNMEEELEDGHFDKEGTFIFKKNNEIRDNWLDNVDWNKVANNSTKIASSTDDSDSDLVPEANYDLNKSYSQLIELMNPGETVQKAIKRYGKKKRKLSSKPSTDCDDKSKLLILIEVADKILLSTGDYDIYDKTYEDLELHLKKKDASESGTSELKLRKKDAPEKDMFSDDFDSLPHTSTTFGKSVEN